MGGFLILFFLGFFTLGCTATCSRHQTHPQREILCYTTSNDLRLLGNSICRCTTVVHQGHDLQYLNTSVLHGIRKLLQKVNPAIQLVVSISDHKKSLKTSAGAIQDTIAKISTIFTEVDGVELNITAGAKERLLNFVRGLKGEMMRKSEKKRILLSLPTKNVLLAKEFDLKNLAKYVDLFTIPTHYLVGDEELFKTFHPSRLMGLADLLNMDNLVDLIHGLGVNKNKLLISLPASGYKFTLKDKNDNVPGAPTMDEIPSIINRKEFCDIITRGEWILERDSDLTAPYVFNNLNWIAFEDEISTRIKGKYVLLRDLAGLAIDEIVNDSKTNCGRSIAEEVYHSFTDNKRKTREAVLNSLAEDIQTTDNPYPLSVKPSDFRIIQIVDGSGNVRAIRENTQTEFTCLKQGHFVHPKSCNRFYRCVKFNQQIEDYSVFEFDCPEGLSFDEQTEVCVWPGSMPRGSPCPGSSEIAPTTLRRFQCPGDGYYADPNNCRWFFACINLGGGDMMPYEFRCPYGLVFDEKSLTCEWPWLVPACAGKNYEYKGSYGSRHSGLSTDTSPGKNNGSGNDFGKSVYYRHNNSHLQNGDKHGVDSNYTNALHFSPITNSYVTTVTEGVLISTLPLQDDLILTPTKNPLDVTISSVKSNPMPDKSMPSKSSIETSNSEAIITSITQPTYFTKQNGKTDFFVSVKETTFHNLSADNYNNQEVSLAKNSIVKSPSTTTGTSSFQPVSVVADTPSIVTIGNEYHTNEAGTRYYSPVSYNTTEPYYTKKYTSGIGIRSKSTGINDEIQNYQYTGRTQAAIPNEISLSVTPALSTKQSGFRYSSSPYITSSKYPPKLNDTSVKSSYDHPSLNTLSNDYSSVPIPEGAGGNKFFTNHASRTPLMSRGNPFLSSTTVATSFQQSDENIYFSKGPFWNNPFLRSTSGSSVHTEEIYRGNPFLPSTPVASFHKTTGNQFFPNYPIPITANLSYKGNPFLPPTSATSSGNVHYTNQAGHSKETPLSPVTHDGYKTNEYFDNGGRGTIRYNNGLITHKYTEDDVKNGKLSYQVLTPLVMVNETFTPVAGIHTTQAFTKNGPTKTGITTAQLGGSGTYIVGTSKLIPTFDKYNNAHKNFKPQLSWSTSMIPENIFKTSHHPSYVKPWFESTTSVYNNEIKRITTERSAIYDIHMDDKTMRVETSSPVSLTEPNLIKNNKVTIASEQIDAKTISPKIVPKQNSTLFSGSSGVESPASILTGKNLSSNRYKNNKVSPQTASTITDENRDSVLNNDNNFQGQNRKIGSFSTKNPLRNDEIEHPQSSATPFSIMFKNGEETNYGEPTQGTNEEYNYEDQSTTFGEKNFQNKLFGASIRPKGHTLSSATLATSLLNTATRDYSYSQSTVESIDNSGSTKSSTMSLKESTHQWKVSINKPTPTEMSSVSTGFTPTLVKISKDPTTISREDHRIRDTAQPTTTSKTSSKPRDNDKSNNIYNDTTIDISATKLKITSQAPTVTTYNGGYGDSSFVHSSGIDKTLALDNKGKIVVKYSDLHPVLLEKLQAECTCRSDPFTVFNSNGPLLIDSSKGTVDLRNYDETDVYVEIESGKDFSKNTGPTDGKKLKTPAKALTLSSSNGDISSSFSINKTKTREAKNLDNFEKNQVLNEQFHSPEIEFLKITSEGKLECARAGLFRHPKFCNKFYVCYWDEWKQKYTLNVSNCPVHLSFDSSTGACNWPSKGPACQAGHLLA
ncbi:uncharacterized protein LOC135172834 [Diachasmimorpha longicaudata]|uniref:uncharacterized protein LOC135172834 n=1 Tax=Diachasmimorpha longicaudata TaxID=58733 RepID=UPI0030B89B72